MDGSHISTRIVARSIREAELVGEGGLKVPLHGPVRDEVFTNLPLPD